MPTIGAFFLLISTRAAHGGTNGIFVGIVGIMGKTMVSLGENPVFELPTIAHDCPRFFCDLTGRGRPIPPPAARIRRRLQRLAPRTQPVSGTARYRGGASRTPAALVHAPAN